MITQTVDRSCLFKASIHIASNHITHNQMIKETMRGLVFILFL